MFHLVTIYNPYTVDTLRRSMLNKLFVICTFLNRDVSIVQGKCFELTKYP